jgi:hypothetical protein
LKLETADKPLAVIDSQSSPQAQLLLPPAQPGIAMKSMISFALPLYGFLQPPRHKFM